MFNFFVLFISLLFLFIFNKNKIIYKSKIIYYLFIFLIIISFGNINYTISQDLGPTYESETIFGIEQPSEYKIENNQVNSDKPFIPKPVGGYGSLHVVIESIEALNERVISKKAERAEIWLGHLLLARLDKEDVKVKDFKTSRIFDFPIINLKTGYHFISIRLYSKGILWKNKKFHEEIFQVGVHEGKRTTLRRKVPALNW